jgi:sugar lactone lactonase YvrE
VRYSPEGEIDFILPLPVSHPTCAAFGRPDLNMLFITTAYQGMMPEAREAEPEAGNLFIFQTDITGIADPLFRPIDLSRSRIG